MSNCELRVGDRVRVFHEFGKIDGTIDAISGIGSVRISSSSTWWNPKQCRRLVKKKKPETVTVTREQLAKAWDKTVAMSAPVDSYASTSFSRFCLALGIENV